MVKERARACADPGFTLATFLGNEEAFCSMPRTAKPMSAQEAARDDSTSLEIKQAESAAKVTIGKEDSRETEDRPKKTVAVEASPQPQKEKVTDGQPRKPVYEPKPEKCSANRDEQGTAMMKTNLQAAIESLGATFYDERPHGGCLWILADSSGKRARTMLVSCGMRLQLAPEGGGAAAGSPAWWTRDPDPAQFASS